MIITEELNKIFRTDVVETTALDKVNLQVAKGEFVAVMGPSGCGKSTLLNIIGLPDNPSNGKYFFNNVEVSKFREKDRANLSTTIVMVTHSPAHAERANRIVQLFDGHIVTENNIRN